MRKIVFICMALLAMNITRAEDVLQIKPATAQPGAGLNGGELDGTVSTTVNLCNSKDYIALQFDILVPENMQIYFDSDGCSRVYTTTKMGKPIYCHQAHMSIKKAPTQGYEGYDLYTISMFDQVTPNHAFVGNSGGDVITMYFGVPSTMAQGVYPIYMKGIELTTTDKKTVTISEATSYITVGNPTNATLKMRGVIPSFVNEALASETTIGNLDLSNVTASNGTFTYVDKRDVVAPTASVTANVSYQRSVGADNMASLCLPFDATINGYTLSGEQDGYLNFKSVTTLPANTSAIIKGDITVTESNVPLCAAAKQVLSSSESDFYYIKSNTMIKANGSVTIPMFRGYWTLPAGQEVRGIAFDDDTTPIESLTQDEGADAIYTTSGVKLSKVQRGVNIVRGKKLVVK